MISTPFAVTAAAVWLIVVAFAVVALASEPIWEGTGPAEGFALWHGGYNTAEELPATVVRLGLTLPDDGYVVIYGEGSIEVYIENVGWVRDDGLQVIVDCRNGESGVVDGSSIVNITAANRCEKKGGRVLINMIMPWRKFLGRDNRITAVKFPGNYWRFGNDEEDPDDLPFVDRTRGRRR